ncbi:MAG: tetratricopeptide repeat protein, partial [Nannocystaceae bacterium]|nr:tetratricopeptide repeat protein [Nannocystaceae bacterium]
PFEGRTLPALATSVTHGRMRPMPRSVPGWLRDALQTGLSVEPGQRHASMSALLRVLERDRGLGRRSVAVFGAMAIGAVATVGVFRWMAREAVAPPHTERVGLVEPVAAAPDIVAAAPAPDVACETRAVTVDGAWNEPRRAAFVAALRPVEGPEDVESRTVPVLDRWARDYAELAGPLCDPLAAPDLATVQIRCLAEARAEFDALVATATQQNSQALARAAASAAYRLPDVSACGRQPRLLAMPGSAPATHHGRVRLAAADVAGARALGWLGSVTKATSLAAAAVEQARALGHAPLLADALLAHGEILAMRYETDDAIEALVESVSIAEGADAAWVRGVAATHLLRLDGAERNNVTNIERWRRVTGAFVQRLGDPFVTAEVMLSEADVVFGLGEFENAETLLQSTLTLHERLYSETHPKVGGVHLRLAQAQLALGRLDDARVHAEAAMAVLEATLGRLSLQNVAAVRVASRVALAQGRLTDAETLARRSVEDLTLFSTLRHDLDRGTGLLLLGDIFVAQSERDAAQETYEKAKVFHYVGRWRAYPLIRLSALARTGGDTTGARELAREALAIFDVELSFDDVRRVEGLRALAQAHRDHGDLDGARKTLRQVLSIVDTQVGFGPLRSRCQHDLAAVEEADGDLEAALELRDDAHVPFSGAYGQDSVQVVDAVLIRADLAWELGKRDYAKRLYGSLIRRLVVLRGEDHDTTQKARRRSR